MRYRTRHFGWLHVIVVREARLDGRGLPRGAVLVVDAALAIVQIGVAHPARDHIDGDLTKARIKDHDADQLHGLLLDPEITPPQPDSFDPAVCSDPWALSNCLRRALRRILADSNRWMSTVSSGTNCVASTGLPPLSTATVVINTVMADMYEGLVRQ